MGKLEKQMELKLDIKVKESVRSGVEKSLSRATVTVSSLTLSHGWTSLVKFFEGIYYSTALILVRQLVQYKRGEIYPTL